MSGLQFLLKSTVVSGGLWILLVTGLFEFFLVSLI